ncbi:MAG: hypothetical protein KBH82_00485 [Syntrophorhabdaceae bacterium]|jgi:hypothetical protein|nr:hypothetical protein [Syntrophorhabdaceae bacterium]HNQ64190.1 hypothetical protein [Syntrophorhabdaceae bacterium]
MAKDGAFENFTRTFIQRVPRYGFKKIGGRDWRTVNKPMHDSAIMDHIDGKCYIGTIAPWYPKWGLIDIDNKPIKELEKIRDKLGMDDSNSMLYGSERPGHYHLIFAPEYRAAPPTTSLLSDSLKEFCYIQGVELYPTTKKIVRVPFSPHCNFIGEYAYLNNSDYSQKLHWFLKLDPYNLADAPRKSLHSKRLDLNYPANEGLKAPSLNTRAEAMFYMENGIQEQGTREHCQFVILLWLWRQNFTPDDAFNTTVSWLKAKNNGKSKDFNKNPKICIDHIKRQIKRIWGSYYVVGIYPDNIQNEYYGYITPQDIPMIIQIARGSLPRMRFLFNLIKYIYPRRQRGEISVHCSKLISWSSKSTYLKYLMELESIGIVIRTRAYEVGSFSKSIQIKWQFADGCDAILVDGRSPDTLEDCCRELYKFRVDELKAILKNAGVDRRLIGQYTKALLQT